MPYNVTIYRTLPQALIACRSVRHRDHPRAEATVNVPHDPWKQHVLSICQHVMSPHGGNYEDRKHVGGGIGRAIHEMTGMQRRATGEDLLSNSREIRGGFREFLVFCTRLDTTKLHWGDDGRFNRIVPGRISLAFEHHATAYRPHSLTKEMPPTSSPSDSLTARTLCEPSESTHLPPQSSYSTALRCPPHAATGDLMPPAPPANIRGNRRKHLAAGHAFG